jgi:hypothetical protein
VLYIVEMEFTYTEQLTEWHAWYNNHLLTLLSVPGFRSAQRFKSITPTVSPYLALYTLDSAAVIDSPAYRQKGGPASTEPWRSRMTQWHRNLCEGLDEAPTVPLIGWVAVFDRATASAPALPAGYHRLIPTGLDRTIVERGLKWGATAADRPQPSVQNGVSLRVYQPLAERMSQSGI